MNYEKGSFVVIPNKVQMRNLSLGARAVFVELCDMVNEYGNCYPSRKLLSERIKMSVDSADRYLDELEKAGFIVTTQRKNNEGDQTSNLYQVVNLPLPLGTHAHTPLGTHAHLTLPSINSTNLTEKNSVEEVVGEEKEFTREKTDGEGNLLNPDKPKYPTKTTAAMRSVFDIFDDNPERKVWHMRIGERESAAVLFEMFGVEELKQRYTVIKKFRDDVNCPKIHRPSDMLKKMPNMEDYLKSI